MALFKKKDTTLTGNKYNTDRILKKLYMDIMDYPEDCPVDKLAELVNAYANLLDVRLDME